MRTPTITKRLTLSYGALVTGALALAPGDASAQAAFAGTGLKWHEAFAAGTQDDVYTGDFDGDGRADILSITPTVFSSAIVSNTAVVSLSEGVRFRPSVTWSQFLSSPRLAAVGDVNGDGRDDLVLLSRGTGSTMVGGPVSVALSNGTAFATPVTWHANFGLGGANGTSNDPVFLLADVNGDGRDDAVLFVRSARSGAQAGDVYVARSTGVSFGAMERWHDNFAPGAVVPFLGDVDGDGKADLVGLVRNAEGGARQGDVDVALSTGVGFGPTRLWHDMFCVGNEVPAVADVDGDGRADVITFVQDAQADPGRGNVRVSLSNGYVFGDWRDWHGAFSFGGETPRVADVNGDGRSDVISFVRGALPEPARGDVWVAVSVTSGRPVDLRARTMLDRAMSSGISGFYLREVGGPVLAAENEGVIFDPASAIKATVHMHALIEVLEGRRSLTDVVWVPRDTNGSCPIMNGPWVPKTLEAALADMMERSTNQDPAGLRQLFSPAAVEDTIRSLGMVQTRHLGNPGCIANEATLLDFARLYERAASGLLKSRKADFVRLAWDDAPNEIDRFVAWEAAKFPSLGSSFPNQWNAQLVSAQKAGSGGNGTVQTRAVAGFLEVPFCSAGAVALRTYVYGAFMGQAVLRSFGEGGDLNLNIVVAEMLRDTVRDAVRSFAEGGCSL